MPTRIILAERLESHGYAMALDPLSSKGEPGKYSAPLLHEVIGFCVTYGFLTPRRREIASVGSRVIRTEASTRPFIFYNVIDIL